MWEGNLIIILVTNKVNLKNANPKKIRDQLQMLFDKEYINVINLCIRISPLRREIS